MLKFLKKNIVGNENEGWTYAKYLLTFERTGIAGVPYSKSALNHLKMISKKSLKNGKPLIEDPIFSSEIAELEIDLKNTRISLNFSSEWNTALNLIPSGNSEITSSEETVTSELFSSAKTFVVFRNKINKNNKNIYFELLIINNLSSIIIFDFFLLKLKMQLVCAVH